MGMVLEAQRCATLGRREGAGGLLDALEVARIVGDIGQREIELLGEVLAAL